MTTLTPEVAAFIAAHIRTTDDLLFLVMAAEDPDRWWDAARVAEELDLPEPDARDLLEHLASRNLLDIRITAAVRYRFRPGTPELEQAARALAAAYRRNPAVVWRAVAGGARRRALHDFADAFRIRRGPR